MFGFICCDLFTGNNSNDIVGISRICYKLSITKCRTICFYYLMFHIKVQLIRIPNEFGLYVKLDSGWSECLNNFLSILIIISKGHICVVDIRHRYILPIPFAPIDSTLVTQKQYDATNVCFLMQQRHFERNERKRG